MDSLNKIRLIDFGLASRYKDDKGDHIPLTRVDSFKGNFIFASRHGFNNIAYSRRDDMNSLAYLLLYILDGDIPFLAEMQSSNRLEDLSLQ